MNDLMSGPQTFFVGPGRKYFRLYDKIIGTMFLMNKIQNIIGYM